MTLLRLFLCRSLSFYPQKIKFMIESPITEKTSISQPAWLTILRIMLGFILTGLFTRTSCIIQIPILLVAIFFVNAKNIGQSGFELVISIVVLALMVLFAVKGSGTLSADEFFRTYYRAGTDDGQTERFFKKK